MPTPFAPRAYIVTESQSRYSLLGAFGMQFAEAMLRQGVNVNPDAGGPVAWGKPGPAMFAFFNHLASAEETYDWAGGPERAGERSIMQWCVDHPLTLDAAWLDRMSQDPGFRLLTVTTDDAHLLAMRFPNLKHATVWHGVAPEALCDEAAIASSHQCGRDIDVLIAGSIPSKDELARLKNRLPHVLHGVCDALVEIRTECPAMSFGQALDVCLPSGVRANDEWGLMAALFAYSTAAVGRARRIAAAQAMQGLNVTLVGTDAWREVATGTLRYAGNMPYGELPAMLKRTKVCLAVSPPQFAAGFSERVLLSMAAGCATVAEERLAISREFCAVGGGPVVQYAPDRPELARIAVGKLLTDGDERARMGRMGRSVVTAKHLWDHRVGVVLTAAGVLERDGARAAA
jgi:hypothetical protein